MVGYGRRVERRLRLLATDIAVRTDEPGLVADFLSVFSGAEVPPDRPGPPPGLVLSVDAGAGRYDDGRRTVNLSPDGPLRRTQVYNLLYSSIVRGLDDAYLIHAAALAWRDLAWLVAGPSGSGKSSLALALARRGFGVLSDDIAPLSVHDRLVHPFPRRLGLLREEGLVDTGIVLGDKRFVEPADLGAEPARVPLPLGGVVITNPWSATARPASPGEPRREIQMEIGFLRGAAEFAAALAGSRDLRVESSAAKGWTHCLVTARGGDALEALGTELARRDADVLYQSRLWGEAREFAPVPALEPCGTREAAEALLAELLNREPDGSLMRRHGGRLGSALLELAGLLGRVPSWRLTAGPVEATADLLVATFGAGATR